MQMGCKLAGEGDRLLTAPLALEKKIYQRKERRFSISLCLSARDKDLNVKVQQSYCGWNSLKVNSQASRIRVTIVFFERERGGRKNCFLTISRFCEF